MDPKYKYLQTATGTWSLPTFETQFGILISKAGVINQVMCEDEDSERGYGYAPLEHWFFCWWWSKHNAFPTVSIGMERVVSETLRAYKNYFPNDSLWFVCRADSGCALLVPLLVYTL